MNDRSELIDAAQSALDYHVTGQVDLEVATNVVPLVLDPRFESIWKYVQSEVTRTALHFRDLSLLRTCRTVLETRTVEENGVEIEEVVLDRAATPEEIADPANFPKEKREATAFGYHAARACARRLTRYYGLRSRYA